MNLNEIQTTIYINESGTVSITINAYGTVALDVISPSGVTTSFTQEAVNVNGQNTIDLTVCPTQSGTYTVTVNASIFPGFYVTKQLTVIVKIPTYRVTFEYNVVGQQLPQHPQVTLQFPNGTTTTITIYNSGETITVPAGTVYTFQQIISQGSNTRWATQTLVTGVIKENNSVVSATYYEQYLVDFEYQVTNGQWTSTPPTVVYYNFTSKASVSLPAQVWVNYNSTYYYYKGVVLNYACDPLNNSYILLENLTINYNDQELYSKANIIYVTNQGFMKLTNIYSIQYSTMYPIYIYSDSTRCLCATSEFKLNSFSF